MKHKHRIDETLCKGCGLCVALCPKNVLELSKKVSAKGYFPAFQARPDDCIYCAICGTMCPDVAIDISECAQPESEPGKPKSKGKRRKS